MSKWILRAILLVAIVVIGVLGWKHFSLNPEAQIRSALVDLARTASFTSSESKISKMAATQKLLDRCTPDIEIGVDVPGFAHQTLSGKDELKQTALVVRYQLSALSVEFLDITIALAPDKQSAIVNLTAKIRVPSEREFIPQELKFTMNQVDGKWLIRKIETVRTLQ